MDEIFGWVLVCALLFLAGIGFGMGLGKSLALDIVTDRCIKNGVLIIDETAMRCIPFINEGRVIQG